MKFLSDKDALARIIRCGVQLCGYSISTATTKQKTRMKESVGTMSAKRKMSLMSGLLFIFLASLSVGQAALTAHWKFDQQDVPAAGQTPDELGLHHGSYSIGAAGGFAPGRMSNAFFIDGDLSSFVGASDADGGLTFGTNDFTIALWLKFTSDNSGGGIHLLVSKRDAASRAGFSDQPGFVIYAIDHPENNPQSRHLEMYSAAGKWNFQGFYNFNQDQWYHVAFVRSGSTLQSYVDGAPLQTFNIGAIDLADAGLDLVLGNTWGPLNGGLDDVRFYKGALSQAEIEALLAPPPPAGLIAHWKFDQQDVPDAGQTPDELGLHNGYYTIGAAGGFNPGRLDNAFYIDSDPSSMVEASDADGGLTFGTNDFTIALWLKFTSDNSGGGIHLLVSKRDAASRAGFTGQPGFVIYAIDHAENNPQSRHLEMYTAAGKWNFQGFYNFNQDQWYHVAFVRSGSTLQSYVNAAPLQTFNIGEIDLADAGLDLVLGNTWGPLNGGLDDVRFYKAALSQAEIQAISGLQPPQLVAYYKFDGDLTDSTTNGLNGVATGTINFVPGRAGQMAEFSGDTGITVANNALLNFGSDGFSAAMWLRVDSANADQNIIAKSDGSASGFRYRSQAGTAANLAVDDGAGTQLAGPFTNKFALGELHHLVYVSRPSAPTGKLYIDGLITDSYSASLNVNNSGDLKIGFATVGPGSGARLAIDELQIYNYELSQAAITDLALAPPPLPALPPSHSHQQDSGPDGLLVFEAEHFMTNVPAGGTSWVYTNRVAGYSADGYMQALPNADPGRNVNIDISNSPRLDFKVLFTQTGTHYVWVRGLADSAPGPSQNDSVNVGLDGQLPATSDRVTGFPQDAGYVWSNTTADSAPPAFEVSAAGEHTINVWMREDGFIIDKVLITTNPDYTPADLGPNDVPIFPPPPPAQLFAHWKFDQQDVPEAGQTPDELGLHHGSYSIGGAGGFGPGRLGNAFYNESDPSSWVEASDADGGLTFGTNDFTIALWLKFTSDNSGSGIHLLVSKRDAASRAGFSDQPGFVIYAIDEPGNNPQSRHLEMYSAAGKWKFQGFYDFNQDQWYHVAFVRSGSTLQSYVDGAPLTTYHIGAIDLADAGLDLVLGNTWGPLNGGLDDVRFYKGALSQAEIEALLAAPLPGPLIIARSGNDVVISWPGTGTLQSADEVTGGLWTDVADATSPHTVTPSTARKFYRLKL